MDFDKGCEECGIENESLVNTITDNRSMRLCSRCAKNNNSLVLEEEMQKQKERIEMIQLKKQQKIQGINTETEIKKPVSLNDLWDRYKKVKEEKEKKLKTEVNSSILDEKKFVEDLEIKKQQEKQELVDEIDREIMPEKVQEDKVEFNAQANKKINIKELFKKTLKLLKKDQANKTDQKYPIDQPNQINQTHQTDQINQEFKEQIDNQNAN